MFLKEAFLLFCVRRLDAEDQRNMANLVRSFHSVDFQSTACWPWKKNWIWIQVNIHLRSLALNII